MISAAAVLPRKEGKAPLFGLFQAFFLCKLLEAVQAELHGLQAADLVVAVHLLELIAFLLAL